MAVLFLFLASPAVSEVFVVDGDTLGLNGTRYRIDGIDAPEAGQKCNSNTGTWACGKAATERISSLVLGQTVTCQPVKQDGYGRTIATCFANGQDIGEMMVLQGMAWAFVRYSDVYVAQELMARNKKLGIWQAATIPPWEYRSQKWSVAEQKSPDGCPIKGNISKRGKIYHAPWSPWYSRTKINTVKGERWFCSEKEAVEAGWRAPRWR